MPDKIKLVAQFKCDNEVMSLKVHKTTDQYQIAFLDSECTLGSVHVPDMDVQEIDEDIDMAEIDAMMEEEDREERAKVASSDAIDIEEMQEALGDAPEESKDEVTANKEIKAAAVEVPEEKMSVEVSKKVS